MATTTGAAVAAAGAASGVEAKEEAAGVVASGAGAGVVSCAVDAAAGSDVVAAGADGVVALPIANDVDASEEEGDPPSWLVASCEEEGDVLVEEEGGNCSEEDGVSGFCSVSPLFTTSATNSITRVGMLSIISTTLLSSDTEYCQPT